MFQAWWSFARPLSIHHALSLPHLICHFITSVGEILSVIKQGIYWFLISVNSQFLTSTVNGSCDFYLWYCTLKTCVLMNSRNRLVTVGLSPVHYVCNRIFQFLVYHSEALTNVYHCVPLSVSQSESCCTVR